ncbi:FAD-dependent oxidoreductase [Halalkaliarchaeum sp. AArc-GB]|uniref:NAD(P)/FAD-dependent oxidoreductase n=1 Tax=Halalkaliarchaeum sp. AArc-GB TaxID=3074078 RepID=UPI002866AC65|nr:FAD-dependent oxidoreductase [Halalkaliarchaeum sp. AArc-GB]MDR5673232.1 FAD-dependent oxidoreductase [Halalkaliarchaeum sp. AArc-GB]
MRVVVFGAGYAGLTLTQRLESSLPDSVELLLVDETETHLVRHELHRLIRRPDVIHAIEVPLGSVLDRARVVTGRVDGIDPEAGLATFRDGRVPEVAGEDGTLAYDYGAVCLGSETAFYDLPGVEEHAIPLKRKEHALSIRDRFLDVCETAETGETCRVVIGGGGLSGIQIAGELAALARERNVPVGPVNGTDATDAGRIEIVLLEQLETLAPGFGSSFQRAIRAALADHGVDVKTKTPVREATADAVETDAGTLETDLFVWAGGIRGPDATAGERPTVRADLRLTESTFLIGDAGRIVDADGRSVPATASAAIRASETAAENLTRLVEHALDESSEFEPSLERYRYSVPGWAVSVGDEAVAVVGGQVLTGQAARKLKAAIGGGYLASTRATRQAIQLVQSELGLPERGLSDLAER